MSMSQDFKNRNFFSKPELGHSLLDKKISLVVPWRETPSRINLFNFLVSWYSKEFDNVDIILSDSNHEIFNAAASRNLGIKKAFDKGAEVVVCSDSDIFISKEALIDSINNAISTNNITIPYTQLRKITKMGTEQFLLNNQESFDMIEKKVDTPRLIGGKTNVLWPCGGVIIITKTMFDDFGGMDESYSGWGVEDIDYHKKYLDKYGRLFDYITGVALSLYHSREEWKNPDNRNIEIFKSKYGQGYLF